MAHDFDADWQALIDSAIESHLTSLSPEQLQALGELDQEQLNERMESAISASVEGAAGLLAEALKERGPQMLEDRARIRAEFEASLERQWAEAFALSQMVIVAAQEMSEEWYAKNVPPDGVHDWTFEVLSRLQARALRIAEEVLVLLRAGYGEAGSARWRTLHETAVITYFIAADGDDCAERFMAHEGVERWKAMQEFQEHAEVLEEERYTAEELAAGEAEYKALLARYGESFRFDFGWAQHALAASDPRFERARATFKDIELAANVGHNRPFYRLASYPNHSQPRSLVLMPDSPIIDGRDVLLTGPSPIGLSSAGTSTLITLVGITATTLAYTKGAATAFLITTLSRLADEAREAYQRGERAESLKNNDFTPQAGTEESTRQRRRSWPPRSR